MIGIIGGTSLFNIQLFEDEHSISPLEYQGISFDPEEYMDVTFDWSTTFAYKSLEIVYAPSSIKGLATEDNSGSKTIEVSVNPKEKENTPGFEFSLIAIIVSIVLLLKYAVTKKRS